MLVKYDLVARAGVAGASRARAASSARALCVCVRVRVSEIRFVFLVVVEPTLECELPGTVGGKREESE